MKLKLPAKEKAVFQIVVNILVWLAFGGVSIAVFSLRGHSLAEKFPIKEITSLVSVAGFIILACAGVIVFGIFAFLRHKSKNAKDDQRAKYFCTLAIDECASVVLNFGSLLFLCAFLGAGFAYVAVAIVCFLLAYYLKESDQINLRGEA